MINEVATSVTSGGSTDLSRRGAIITVIGAFYSTLTTGATAMTAVGLITIKSNNGPRDTMTRLKAAVIADPALRPLQIQVDMLRPPPR